MSATRQSPAAGWGRALVGVGAVLAAAAAAAMLAPDKFGLGRTVEWTPHAPDFSVLGQVGWPIRIHVGAAVAALAIGFVLLLGPKGTTPHRTLGWIWVVMMAAAAVSSLFIMEINPGFFSFIHILTGLTLVSLPGAVYAARRHNVAAHKRAMTSLFLGALVVAGVLAFLPGRLMWRMFFG